MTLQSENPSDKPEQLTIYNVTKEDEGWYVCVALNSLGNTTAKGYLTVLDCKYYSELLEQLDSNHNIRETLLCDFAKILTALTKLHLV